MAKKNGALFSRAMFGYKRKDVVEYIRTVDVNHADELSRINSENESLQKKLDASEMLCRELENKLAQEKASAQESQKKLTLEYEKKLADLNNAVNLQKDKLNDSESRASSYLKLIDSSSMRAESAEAELTVLSAAIEDYKAEIADLKSKLADKENELKKSSEFEILAKKIIESNNQKKQSDFSSFLSLFRKSRNHK